jgi:RsiW-degrading membrane proteinase PrsW (M82 family)
LVLELVIGGGLALLALLGIAMVMGQEAVAEIAKAFTQVPTDTGRIIEIVFQQPLSAAIAGGAALLMIVLLVPLVEELLKSAGVAIVLTRRRRANFLPTRGNAVLWGLAAGAGFAFSENMLNGQGTLNDPNSLTGFWAGAMILRAGTSLMHMITTATVAAGWYEALIARRPIRLPLLLLTAVLMHAIWNTSALLLAGVSMTRTANTPLASISTGLSLAALGLLAFLFVGCVFWLRALLQWARRSPISIPT